MLWFKTDEGVRLYLKCLIAEMWNQSLAKDVIPDYRTDKNENKCLGELLGRGKIFDLLEKIKSKGLCSLLTPAQAENITLGRFVRGIRNGDWMRPSERVTFNKDPLAYARDLEDGLEMAHFYDLRRVQPSYCDHTASGKDSEFESYRDHTASGKDSEFELLDSGKRRDFKTGSRRDVRTGKGRFDLLNPIVLKRIAQHYENGAKKYGDHNWELGQPCSSYLDSLERHTNSFKEGKRDEDHLAAVIWNAGAIIYTLEMINRGILPGELNDLPDYMTKDGFEKTVKRLCMEHLEREKGAKSKPAISENEDS